MLKFTHSDEEKDKNLFAIKKVRESEEYKQNQMEIDSIKNVLIKSADVPEKLINWLITAVKNNAILEYKATKSHTKNPY